MQSPVPMFVHSLTALSKILDKAEAFAEAKKIKPEVFKGVRTVQDVIMIVVSLETGTDAGQ